MDRLQVRTSALTATKQKAMEDAKKMQVTVEDQCVKAGKEKPPYLLQELIGKGSFGRVYKATDLNSKSVVAVKILDIEESDTVNPKLADTYSEFLKEINALKRLSNSGARNINLILDALPVGQTMWMVTEYCAGGSVSTLMKPHDGGLHERWIIPILREVAEAIYWVHKEGIIHRDIKCANVLVTETGFVQLCDFGVAGVVETKFDKRSTFIGTPHWMAPELFDDVPSYSTPVDIWAFGSLVYEIASGKPPNAQAGFGVEALGNYIKIHVPRLEGDQYSSQLKDLVAFCMVGDPSKRPAIEQIQRHPYIFNTSNQYPTTSLANLVKAYKVWEAQGGVRRSLFGPGGAQGPSDYSTTAMANDEWNFSTTLEFDRQVMNMDAQAVYDAYGSSVDLDFTEQLPRPTKPKGRRRPPPQLPAFKAPIEKLFDPNTITSYDENSRAYYGKPPPPPTSDLPLRDDSLHSTLRESLIDLDMSLHDGGDLSQFVDMETLKPIRQNSGDSELGGTPDYNKPPSSDPADVNRRATQDWKFPSMPPPLSADPEMSRFPFNEDRPSGISPRPGLFHHATDSLALQSQPKDLMVPTGQDNRASIGSLIDLDEGLAVPDFSRPSTANSDAASISGSEMGGANPFDLERHASYYEPFQSTGREPSIYISDDSDFARQALMPDEPLPPPQMPGVMADYARSSSNTLVSHGRTDSYEEDRYSGVTEYISDPGYLTMSGPPRQNSRPSMFQQREQQQPRTASVMPPMPEPPSARVMQNLAGRDETREEVMRLMKSLLEHLSCTEAHVSAIPTRTAGGGSAPSMNSRRE